MLCVGDNRVRNAREIPWTLSLLLHALALSALVLVSPADNTVRTSTTSASAVMPLMVTPPARVTPVVLRAKFVYQPVPRLSRAVARVSPPAPLVIPPPKPSQPQLAVASPEPPPQIALHLDTPAVVASVQLPQPIPAVPVNFVPAPVRAVAAPVKTGLFGAPGVSPDGHVPAPRLEVQTGAFGGPDNRVSASTGSGNAVRLGVKTGAFGDSQGSHNASGRPTGSSGPVTLAEAGFGNAAAPAAAPHRVEATPVETPVEILWKPKPQYTDEARTKKLEGTVTLEVVFQATGTVHVVRVVRGLGCGLNDSAFAAAAQIRFTPGKKDGIPVDRTGMVQILFALS